MVGFEYSVGWHEGWIGLVISALMRDVRDKKVIDLIKAALTTPVITSKVEEPRKRRGGSIKRREFWLKMSQSLIHIGWSPFSVLHLTRLRKFLHGGTVVSLVLCWLMFVLMN